MEINEILKKLNMYNPPHPSKDYSSERSSWNSAIHRFAEEVRPVLQAKNHKIEELERIVVEAKECVRITQEKTAVRQELDKLQHLLDDTVAKHEESMVVAKERIAALGKEIDTLRTSNSKALEQIWNKLKLVRIQI